MSRSADSPGYARVKRPGGTIIRLRGCRVRVSMAARRRSRGGSNELPPSARRALDYEGDRCGLQTTTSTHKHSLRPAGARSNAITRAPPAAGLYDARSNYRRHALSTMESTLETTAPRRRFLWCCSSLPLPSARPSRHRHAVDAGRERSNVQCTPAACLTSDTFRRLSKYSISRIRHLKDVRRTNVQSICVDWKST